MEQFFVIYSWHLVRVETQLILGLFNQMFKGLFQTMHIVII